MKLDIADLDDRIAIIGGSNAGKSTLSIKLGKELGLQSIILTYIDFSPARFG